MTAFLFVSGAVCTLVWLATRDGFLTFWAFCASFPLSVCAALWWETHIG